MLTAINNLMNDHQFMNAAINIVAFCGLCIGAWGLYLAATYEQRFPARRKR